MPATLKRKQVRIYLDAVKQAQFDSLVKRIGSLSEAVIMTTLVSSALDACVAAGFKIPLPLVFHIADCPPVFSDKQTGYSQRRQ